nr:uncharacterized protein I203_06570 [Kwoniella mangroviensis CBS 8507]OCF64389.1 hypothetical protein I203_06570 [Kwoniella mangroviensis CBS 8507]
MYFPDLSPTEMVKPPELTMLDAMNAIQMMDPKMDTGASDLQERRSSLVYSPAASLSSADLCWTMDNMLALEVAWYRGATLCQSVYTALHYHNPHHLAGPPQGTDTDHRSYLVHLVLRAYVLLYCKSIDLAYTEFAKGHVRDGEDCWLDHYGVAVRMSDPVEDVVNLANEALEWLEHQYSPVSYHWSDQMSKRLIHRRNWVQYLASSSETSTSCSPLLRVMRIASDGIELITDSSDVAKAAFDSSIPSYLRQHMPLPEFEHPTQSLAWKDMKVIVDELINVEAIVSQEDSWDTWTTRFDFACDQVVGGRHGNDRAVRMLIFEETGYSNAAVQLYDNVTNGGNAAVDHQINIWKNLVSSYLTATMSTFLSNRSRQFRSFSILSASWRERAAMGEYLSKYRDLSEITQVVHAIRLDCLIESNLAALDSDLVTSLDEAELWWWMQQVTSSRSQLCQRSQSWSSIWAKLWLALSSAICLLLTIHPIHDGGPVYSDARFKLRHKHTLKAIYLSDGKRAKSGLTPSFQRFQMDQESLKRIQPTKSLNDALLKLNEASQWIRQIIEMKREDTVDLTDFYVGKTVNQRR